MSIESSMTRPLFEEPSWEHEREDPFSGPKGFMFGGMALPTRMELGQQYFRAAELLIEAIKQDKLEDYRLANPVLFLYRHSIELTIKGLIHSDGDGHSLAKLAESFSVYIRRQFGQEVPGWVKTRFEELAEMDPNSTAFRYAENYDKQCKQYVPVGGEIYVGINHLHDAMKTLNSVLLRVWEADEDRERNLD